MISEGRAQWRAMGGCCAGTEIAEQTGAQQRAKTTNGMMKIRQSKMLDFPR
jgi:hypothetical protein